MDIKGFERNTEINVYFVNLKETNFTRRQLLSEMKVFTDFMERFHCTIDELMDALNMFGIQDKNLFDYTTNKTNYLVCENGLYRKVKEPVKGNFYTHGYYLKTVYYDLYLDSNSFVSLSLNIIAEHIVSTRFPFLVKKPFTKMVKRFSDDIINLPTSVYAKLGDIDYNLCFNNKLRIIDLIKLYTDKTYKDSLAEKSCLRVYSETYGRPPMVYLNFGKETETLYLPFEALLNKDWQAIENVYVHSILLYDDNGELIKGKWFSGRQKDAPYFKHPLVEELKKILLS